MPAKDEEHLSNLVVASENFVIGQIKLSSYFRKMRTSLNIVAEPSVCKSKKNISSGLSVCVMANRLLFACIQNTNIYLNHYLRVYKIINTYLNHHFIHLCARSMAIFCKVFF